MTELRVPPEEARRIVRLNTVYILCLGPLFVLPLIPSGLLLPGGSIALVLASVGLLYVSAVLATRWLAFRFVRRSGVCFGDGSYRIGRLVGADRVYRADELSLAVLAEQFSLGVMRPALHLIVAGQKGPALLLVSQMFTVDQLEELAADLWRNGVAVERASQPLTAAALRRRDPRLIHWWRAHPVIFALLLMVAAVFILFFALFVVILAFI
ncbi:hypothetical protein JL108_05325 [Aeromicrobium sp. YIM 150415]|uniref:PH domain-containing protein n=1 Tax=Aeromicrobium piscarium TaxID=2590901 RepID=A0A554SGN7_9ACTN|nr:MULTISPECIES: hypothetical protein [Aeromicrobium]MBM9462862.1 hypothetical protein [Aeromicrobium sp. YIM 150415]TSD65517.1 hypothetical protein FNM00_03570 [Aeromicrobium piscarium]